MAIKNIAILTGGDSAEKVISYQSADVVARYLPADAYRVFKIDIQGSRWTHLDSGKNIDKNDFSLRLDGKKIKFKCAFAALHGSPMEDGKLQGYFEQLGIPYTCCSGYVSALTMNKHNTKTQVAPYKIPLAQSVLLLKGHKPDWEKINALGLPVFVKPNSHGSSFGVTKVKSEADLATAIENAFAFDSEVLVEAFMPGREFSNGVFRHKGKVTVLPITEIIPQTEFFDYEAKYLGKSREVTPADLSPALTRQCQERSKLLYQILQCSGCVRFDYILVGEVFYFLEANTIPGISDASLIPQQARAAGWDLGAFFAALVEESIRQTKK